MSRHLPAHALMVTFLSEALSRRKITLEHLADLMAPTPEDLIRSWFDGSESPSPDHLVPLATALELHPVEMIAGWMIDQAPEIERAVRTLALGPIGSRFPRTTDLDLRAPRPMPSMKVPDPHDEREPGTTKIACDFGPVRKRASGARIR